MREETTRGVNSLGLSEATRIRDEAQTDMYWGYFWWEAAFPKGPAFDAATLAEMAAQELETLQRIFVRVFPSVSY